MRERERECVVETRLLREARENVSLERVRAA